MVARVLIDNISKDELLPEWGLCIYIEHDGHTILLDTGGSDKFVTNAKALGISLEKIEYGVLSHAHYDHADGMEAFFKANKSASFFLRAGTGENCYGKRWIFHKYIGIPKGILKGYEERIVYASGDFEFYPGAYLIPHKTPGLEHIGKKANMYVKKKCRFYPDAFCHEQSLVLETEKGLVIFNSCSHAGADNIINEVADTFPGQKIYALIGGFHLFASTEAEIRALAKRIRATGIEKVITGHCTGKRAYGILKEELGDCVEQMYTGFEVSI